MQESSIEINKNSRGYTYSVKVYDEDIGLIKSRVSELTKFCESEIITLKKESEES